MNLFDIRQFILHDDRGTLIFPTLNSLRNRNLYGPFHIRDKDLQNTHTQFPDKSVQS
jgi:hypothetical protein